MTKKHSFISLFSIILLSVSCNGSHSLDQNRQQEKVEEKYCEISLNYTTLSSVDRKMDKACIFFNRVLSDSIHTEKESFQNYVQKVRKELENKGITMRFPYILSVRDSVFRADSKYISLRVETYRMTGGANGTTRFYAFNYDMKKGKMLSKNELFKTGVEEKVKALLKKYLKDPEGCFTFEKPTLDNCSTVNFTRESIIFTYEKYVLGPGYCGTPSISVPLEELEGMLNIQ